MNLLVFRVWKSQRMETLNLMRNIKLKSKLFKLIINFLSNRKSVCDLLRRKLTSSSQSIRNQCTNSSSHKSTKQRRNLNERNGINSLKFLPWKRQNLTLLILRFSALKRMKWMRLRILNDWDVNETRELICQIIIIKFLILFLSIHWWDLWTVLNYIGIFASWFEQKIEKLVCRSKCQNFYCLSPFFKVWLLDLGSIRVQEVRTGWMK